MSAHDDDSKTGNVEARLPVSADEDVPRLTLEQLLDVAIALEALDWSAGLTRNQMRRRYRALPLAIYLRLPASKRYASAAEVLYEAGAAESRAEGEYLGASPEIPAEASVADGGPPDWGRQPAVYNEGASISGGSSEDTEGLLPGEHPGPGEEPAP